MTKCSFWRRGISAYLPARSVAHHSIPGFGDSIRSVVKYADTELCRGDRLENTDSINLIRRFIAACVRADPDEFAGYFTEEAIWWNAPWPPVKGRANIRETLRRGAGRMTALPWEIRHIMAVGNLVMTERVDHFLLGNNRISVPCMGIFELQDGKIAAWRDYWDLKQFEAQLQSPASSGG